MSEYSQKYCLVSLVEPIAEGLIFDYSDWPLHATLADTFSCDLGLILGVGDIIKNYECITARGESHQVFGSSDRPTPVILLSKPDKLMQLHNEVMDYLLSNGAVFNNPEFTKEGFLPHCTVQKNNMINIGDDVALTSISIVDMYVDNDWKKRKVIKSFDFIH